MLAASMVCPYKGKCKGAVVMEINDCRKCWRDYLLDKTEYSKPDYEDTD